MGSLSQQGLDEPSAFPFVRGRVRRVRLWRTLFGGILTRLCWTFGTSNLDIGWNVLLCVFGALLGWTVGMFFSPFTKEDAARFQFLGKTIAAFASGYVLSKFDALISTLIKGAGEHPEKVPWERVGLFGSSFLLAAIVVFVSRAYSHQVAIGNTTSA